MKNEPKHNNPTVWLGDQWKPRSALASDIEVFAPDLPFCDLEQNTLYPFKYERG